MNKKVVFIVLTASLGSLCIFGSLLIAFANVPDKIEGDYLLNQNFAKSMSAYNEQISPLNDDNAF
jgi:hypothetical protein